MSNELLSIKKEILEKDNKINSDEEKIKELKEEIEQKNSQVEDIIKNINDYELQLKGLRDDKQELINNNKKLKNQMKEKDNLYDTLKKDYEAIKKENKKLQEEKKNKDEDISNNLIVEMDEEEIKKEDELNRLRDNLEEITNNLNQKNEECEKYKTSYLEMKKKIDKMSLELKQKNENNNINNTINDKSEKTYEKDTEMSSVENEHKEIIKENANLKNKISQLNEEITKLNTQINDMNSKLEEKEKILKNKEIELNNMKEISQAMIEKEKKKIEQNENITPSNSTIISNKVYKKLTWYLIYKYNPNNNNNKDDKKPNENNYNSYQWVNGNVITRENLKKYNNFEDEEKKIGELNEYIVQLQKKLEKKEESINKLDYKNKKLNEQIQNKTASVKGGVGLSRMSDTDKNKLKNNFANSMTSNEGTNEMDKFKNILDQLNDSNKTNTILKNKIIELKSQLEKKEEFESGIPKDFKMIENKSFDSGFLDEELKDNPHEGMMNFLKASTIKKNKQNELLMSIKSEKEIKNSINDTFKKEAEKKADEFLREGLGDESDYNEYKQMQKQMKFIKEQLKESIQKYDLLSGQVEELLKNIKCDIKIKPQIAQICQIFGYSPQTTSRILNNKKGGLFGIKKNK